MKHNWNILLIDDDEDDYIITREMLSETRGARTYLKWASTYDQGYQALQSDRYDAVLLDYDLGEKTGLDLVREFVAMDYPSPLILLTGRGNYEVDVEAMQAGASLYLTKTEANPLLLERSIRYAIERKQIETALRQSETMLETAQRVARLGSWQLNLKTGVGTWSPEMFHLTGFDPAKGMPSFEEFLQWVHADDRQIFLDMQEKILRTGEPVAYEYRTCSDQHSVRYFLVNLEAERDEQGEVFQVFGTTQDITDQKRIEEQNVYQALLMDNILDAVVSTDAEFTIRSWNKAAEAIYGWTEEEVVGRRVAEILPTEYVQDTREDSLKRLHSTGSWKGLVRQQHRDGTWIDVMSSVSAIHSSTGKITGAVAVNRSINERGLMEKALLKMRPQPGESSERYQELVANSPFAIGIYQNEKIVLANPAAVRLFGAHDENDLLGRDVRELLYREDWESVCSLEENMQRGDRGIFPAQMQFIRLDGHVVDVEALLTRISFNGNPATQVIAYESKR